MRGMRGNLPPSCASHRSGLRQPRHANYTRTTVNHTNNNSKKRSTPKPKYEYTDDVVIDKKGTTPLKQKTRKHKSREQESPYYNHNSKHDRMIKPYLDAIASFSIE